MKSIIVTFWMSFLCMLPVKSQTTGNNVTDVILNSYTARALNNKPVSDKDVELILQCGIKAPSAMNSQRWRFTVVKDNDLMKSIIADIISGNVIIVVSGENMPQGGMNVDFDCALATENMYIAAQGLGLGAHIYTGPVNNINAKLKDALGIPDNYKAIALLRVGNVDNGVDAVSSASTRKNFNEVVNYK